MNNWDGAYSDLPAGTFAPQARWHIPWRWILFIGFIAINFLLISIISVQVSYRIRIHKQMITLPYDAQAAIILGAALKPDGSLSDVLSDRVKTGVELYKSRSVRYLIMSGDDGKNNRDEVSVMAKAAREAGVPANAIIVDGKGYRTYESCKNAIQTYHVTKAVVVTQRFHLPRALFLCNELGIEAYGFAADKQTYTKISWFQFRDILASVKAFWDVFILQPKSPVT
jgi:vancomycin permeability regulator SanA